MSKPPSYPVTAEHELRAIIGDASKSDETRNLATQLLHVWTVTRTHFKGEVACDGSLAGRVHYLIELAKFLMADQRDRLDKALTGGR